MRCGDGEDRFLPLATTLGPAARTSRSTSPLCCSRRAAGLSTESAAGRCVLPRTLAGAREQRAASSIAAARARAVRALRKPAQLGPAGQVLQPSARAATRSTSSSTRRSLHGAGFHYAAGGDVLVPRRRHEQLHLEPRSGRSAASAATSATRGCASSSSSLLALVANLALLTGFVAFGVDKVVAQAIAVVLVTPLNFVGNKLWSFRAPLRLAPAARALAAARARRRSRSPRHAATTRRRPVYDVAGSPDPGAARAAPAQRAADEAQATRSSSRTARSPTGCAATRSTTRVDRRDLRRSARLEGQGLVGRGGRDRRRARSTTRPGVVTEAWTGPQVAWKMARGYDGAFGGSEINSAAGLARLLPRSSWSGSPTSRRPLSAAQPRPARAALVLGLALVLQPRRHLHERPARLPAAASTCSARMVWMRAGAAAAGLVAAGLAGLAARRRRRSSSTGFRIGLNVRDSNVIDVGYSGVIGAQRIVHGRVAVRPLARSRGT